MTAKYTEIPDCVENLQSKKQQQQDSIFYTVRDQDKLQNKFITFNLASECQPKQKLFLLYYYYCIHILYHFSKNFKAAYMVVTPSPLILPKTM